MLPITLPLLLAFASSLKVVDADAAYGPVVDQVDLPYGHFQGYTNQTSNLTYFLGIPYAAAPCVFSIYHPTI
jgi:hypothetical protein